MSRIHPAPHDDTWPRGARSARGARLLFLILALTPLAAPAGAPLGPIAFTWHGWIEGRHVDGADRFLGVPFAAPPTGDRRFRAPAPPTRWSGLRPAQESGPACPQLASPNGPRSEAEDCLYLNVYRPKLRRASAIRRLPVVIWIHGGAGISGSADQFDASSLARRTGVIVVSISYRLGVFGYLALPELGAETHDGASGNLALADQQAAMRWVRENIRFFGGDPRRVTIAGQSAGGASVCLHLASPTAHGLFDRAIIQSGVFDLLSAGQTPLCNAAPLARAEAAGLAFARRAGCPDERTRATCLRGLSVSQLLDSSVGFVAEAPLGGDLLPMPVMEAVAAGAWNRVPVMVGSTRDELQPGAGLIPGIGFPLPEFFYVLAIQLAFPDRAAEVLAAYPASDFADPAFALHRALTDSVFSCPTHELRRFLARHTRTFGFEFNDPNAPPGERNGVPTGAYHTAELQYLFAVTPSPGELDAAQRALANEMMRYWGAFARRGHPYVRGQAFWPRFRGSGAPVMSLEPGGSRVTRDFAADHRCDFWRRAPPP